MIHLVYLFLLNWCLLFPVCVDPPLSYIFKTAAYLISFSLSYGTSTLCFIENAIWKQLQSLTLPFLVFLLSLGAHAVFNHERMSHWEKSCEKKETERDNEKKRSERREDKKTLKHYEEVRRPVPFFDHPIFWEPRGQSRGRRRCCQVDKLMRWTQRGWTGWIPAYLSVTSLVLSRVLVLGELKKNGNKEQKCSASEDMELYGHFAHSHFKEYLMLHLFIFVQR